jgi:hypothetical protein
MVVRYIDHDDSDVKHGGKKVEHGMRLSKTKLGRLLPENISAVESMTLG